MSNIDPNNPYNLPADKLPVDKESQNFSLSGKDANEKKEMVFLDVPFSHNEEIKQAGATWNKDKSSWQIAKDKVEQSPRLQEFTKPRIVLDTQFLPEHEFKEAKHYDIKRESNEKFTAPNIINVDRPDIIKHFSQEEVNRRQNATKEFVELELPQFQKVDETKGITEKGNHRFSFDTEKMKPLQENLTKNGAFFNKDMGSWVIEKSKFAEKKDALEPYLKEKGETIKLFPKGMEQITKLRESGIYKLEGNLYRIPNTVDKNIAKDVKKTMGPQQSERNVKEYNANQLANSQAEKGQMVYICCQPNTNGREAALAAIKDQHNALIVKQSMPQTFKIDPAQAVKNQETKLVDLIKVVETIRQKNPESPIILQHDNSLNKALNNNQGLANMMDKTCKNNAVQRSWCTAEQMSRGITSNGITNTKDTAWQFEKAKNLINSKLQGQKASQEVKKEVDQKLQQKQEQEKKLEQTQEKTQSKSRKG